MLDQKILERAKNLIEVQFAERNEQLEKDIIKIKHEMNVHGALRSGATLKSIRELCAKELVNRAMLVLQILIRVYSSICTDISERLAEDFKNETMSYIQEAFDELTQVMQKSTKNICSDRDRERILSLTEAKNHAIKKTAAEIDFYVDSISQRVSLEKKGEKPLNIYNINGPIGAFQTGPGSTAHVVQSLGSSEKGELLRALDLVKQSLLAVEKLADYSKEEILELVEESRTEINKEKPNSTKLCSNLTTIATAIQIVTSMNPAYQTLKSALLLLGITLP